MPNETPKRQSWREIAGKQRIYNTKGFPDRDDVVKWDIMTVSDREKLRLIFESQNAQWEQGVDLACDIGVTVEDATGKEATGKGVYLWYDHSPREVEFICHTKDGFLSVYNIWYDTQYGPQSQAHTSGMLIDELPNGRRYRCNDFGFEAKFDKLVFRIERIDSEDPDS
jgi:hypothetical protein